MRQVLVIHGPNLNLLGTREPEIYGGATLEEINRELQEAAGKYGVSVRIIQSNHEGVLLDAIHQAGESVDFIIINPGAFTHYSIAIHDALKAVNIPAIEVHLSNIYRREEFRRHSVVAPAVLGQITGLGKEGYLLALEAAARYLGKKVHDA